MNKFIRDFRPDLIETFHCDVVENCKLNLRQGGTHFTLLHNNIRSISKNFDIFQAFLKQLNFEMDLIVLTETWKVHDVSLFTLRGYDTIYNEGYVCLYCPILPVLLLSNKLYRYLTDVIITFWQQYPAALSKVLCKTEVQVTGDAIRSNEMSILVMNHRTRTDWNVLWPALYHCVEGTNSYKHSTKFLLKEAIRHVPGAGWVMQLSFWIFIKRFWASDRDTLKKLCDYIEALSYKFSMVLFPEGTDFTKETKEKSDSFARKNNLQKYDYLLHPRTTGFAYLSSQLMKQNCLDAIYDLTLVYPDTVPQTEKNLMRGKFPKNVKLHMKRYSATSLPKKEDDLKRFLESIWKNKEDSLREFYTTNNFIPGPVLKKSSLELFPALIFWTILPFIAAYILLNFHEFRKICFLHTIFLLCVDFLTPGFQWFEITLYRLKKEFFGPKFTF